MDKLINIWTQDAKKAEAAALKTKARVFEANTQADIIKREAALETAEAGLVGFIKALSVEHEPSLDRVVAKQVQIAQDKAELEALKGLQKTLFGGK